MGETLGEDDVRYLKSNGIHSVSRSATMLLRAGLLLLLLGWFVDSLASLWSQWEEAMMVPQCGISRMVALRSPTCLTSYLGWFRWQYSERLWLLLFPDKGLAIGIVHIGAALDSFRRSGVAGLELMAAIFLPPLCVGVFVPLLATLGLTRCSLRFRLNAPLVQDFGEGFRLVRLLFIWTVSGGLLYWCISIFVPVGIAQLQLSFETRSLRMDAFVNPLIAIGGAMSGLSIVVQLCAFVGYRMRYTKLLPTLRQKYGE